MLKIFNAKKIALIICLFAYSLQTQAQNEVEAYDQVYMRDGRILKGQIIMFQDSDGDINFKDLDGRTYSITRKQYRFFREDVVYIKGGDTLVVRQRKEEGFGGSVGFYLGGYSSSLSGGNLPVSLHAAFGKYFSRQLYTGLAFDYGFVEGEISQFFNPKAFIKYQYDAYKKNISSYLIGELGYGYMQGEMAAPYYYNDNFNNLQQHTHVVTQEADYLTLTVGHGLGFILKNSNSISVDLVLSRFNALNRNITNHNLESWYKLDKDEPIPSLTTYGIRILVNL